MSGPAIVPNLTPAAIDALLAAEFGDAPAGPPSSPPVVAARDGGPLLHSLLGAEFQALSPTPPPPTMPLERVTGSPPATSDHAARRVTGSPSATSDHAARRVTGSPPATSDHAAQRVPGSPPATADSHGRADRAAVGANTAAGPTGAGAVDSRSWCSSPAAGAQCHQSFLVPDSRPTTSGRPPSPHGRAGAAATGPAPPCSGGRTDPPSPPARGGTHSQPGARRRPTGCRPQRLGRIQSAGGHDRPAVRTAALTHGSPGHPLRLPSWPAAYRRRARSRRRSPRRPTRRPSSTTSPRPQDVTPLPPWRPRSSRPLPARRWPSRHTDTGPKMLAEDVTIMAKGRRRRFRLR